MCEANELYSRGGMWRYCASVCGAESALTKLRIEIRGTRHRWPYRSDDQRRYVVRNHFGALEDLTYGLKRAEAKRMFGSAGKMRKYLERKYGRAVTDRAALEAAGLAVRKNGL